MHSPTPIKLIILRNLVEIIGGTALFAAFLGLVMFYGLLAESVMKGAM